MIVALKTLPQKTPHPNRHLKKKIARVVRHFLRVARVPGLLLPKRLITVRFYCPKHMLSMLLLIIAHTPKMLPFAFGSHPR
jgi:hypothetical protein